MRTLVILIALVVLGFYFYGDQIMPLMMAPTETAIQEGEVIKEAKAPEVIAENLEVPWEIAFLPGGDFLVTERPGRLVRISEEDRSVIPIEGVVHRGEGGLLGLALHPEFESNNWIYLYLTSRNGDELINRIERYTLVGTTLSERTAILENIPGAQFHDGGRLLFGADRYLYATTGDAGDPDTAQDPQNLAGKILRIKDDGSIPEDNPFGNEVYSYGHRNPQGLAWDSEGRLFSSEHGRSGIQSGMDEVNRIESGANYGWPNIEGDETQEGMVGPVLHSGAEDTWAPGDVAYIDGHILFTGLRGSSLFVADLEGNELSNLRTFFRGEYGRLRSVEVGPDGMLYVLTSNQDGRGRPTQGDDRIIKIDPASLGI